MSLYIIGMSGNLQLRMSGKFAMRMGGRFEMQTGGKFNANTQLMPRSRHSAGTGEPLSARLKMAMIWLPIKREVFMQNFQKSDWKTLLLNTFLRGDYRGAIHSLCRFVTHLKIELCFLLLVLHSSVIMISVHSLGPQVDQNFPMAADLPS